MTDVFMMKLDRIQPSQLYINSRKLSLVLEEFDLSRTGTLRPIPIKKLGDDIVSTDGHTRAFAAYMSGLSEIRVFWDEDELDWEAYQICVDQCKKEGIHTVVDLKDRVVNDEDYQRLWRGWCDMMHRELEAKRRNEDGAI